MDFSAGFLPCVRIERNLRNLPAGVSSISVGFRLLFGSFFFFMGGARGRHFRPLCRGLHFRCFCISGGVLLFLKRIFFPSVSQDRVVWAAVTQPKQFQLHSGSRKNH